jgi:hypothetical protein
MNDAVVFLDSINAMSVWRLVLCGNSLRSIGCLNYMNEVTPWGQTWLRFLKWFGLWHGKIYKMDYFFGAMRYPDEPSVWVRVEGKDLPELCLRIQQEEFERSPFVRGLGCYLFSEKVVYAFLRKKVYDNILQDVIQINVVQWMTQSTGPYPPLFVIKSSMWFQHLEHYAQLRGVRLLQYFNFPWNAFVYNKTILRNIFALGERGLSYIGKVIKNRRVNSTPSPKSKPPRRKMLAIHSAGLAPSLNVADRSEIFFLPNSGIDWTQVLLYFSRSDAPITSLQATKLKEKGVTLVCLSADAARLSSLSVWQPSLGILKIGVYSFSQIARILISSILQGGWRQLIYFLELSPLLLQYVYWHDFFSAYNVGINVNRQGYAKGYAGQHLAMMMLNGISVEYQISSAFHPNVDVMPMADIQFTFSDDWAQVHRPYLRAALEFLAVGYIYDVAFHKLADRAQHLRARLESRGVKFVIGFFDENSSNERNMRIRNEWAMRDYEYLFGRLLEDETLGLICKPKKIATLFTRMPSLKSLVYQAESTGRLIMIGVSDYEVTSAVYPAEVGIASDVVIGQLSGRTAAFEAHLVGTPAVLMDNMGISNHSFYDWGKGQVVFDNWDQLFSKLLRYRALPTSEPNFGNWSPIINKLDPFHDGRAAERIGGYLRNLLEALESGQSREQAMLSASARYAEEWGAKHVSSLLNS